MTLEFQIFCGLDTNGRDVDAEKLLSDLAIKYFPDGHSLQEVTGRWARRDHYGPTSEVLTERTIVVIWQVSEVQNVDGRAERLVGRFAKAYKDGAYQEAVLVSKRELDCWMI